MSIDPEIDSQIVNRAKWAASSRHGTIHDQRIGAGHSIMTVIGNREQTLRQLVARLVSGSVALSRPWIRGLTPFRRSQPPERLVRSRLGQDLTAQSPDPRDRKGESFLTRSFSHHPSHHRADHHRAEHASCLCRLLCRRPDPGELLPSGRFENESRRKRERRRCRR